jgi:DNA-binding transcriptional ArsR family regulator
MVNFPPGTLDRTFAAVADPTRRAILHRLSRGEASVKELAAPFDMSLPAISKHLTVLERAGLLQRRKIGRVHHCQLVGQPLGEATAWLMAYRPFWESKLDALEDYLSQNSRDEHDGANGR